MRVAQRDHRTLHIDGFPAFLELGRIEGCNVALDIFIGEQMALLHRNFRGKYIKQVLPQNVFALPAVQCLGARVPGCDVIIDICCDNGILHIFQQFCLVTYLLFVLPVLGDIHR